MLRRAIGARCQGLARPSALRTQARHALTCQLCDQDVNDWTTHSEQRSHIARFAVCTALAAPEKYAAMMGQLWDHVRLDFKLVDEVNAQKLLRRRRRLGSTLKYLKDMNVLTHSQIRTDKAQEVTCTSRYFSRQMYVGDSHARMDLTDRVARLFPKANSEEIASIVDLMLSRHNLDLLFDFIEMHQLCAEGVRLTDEHKAACVLAVIGELSQFVNREKPVSVGTKKAADALVLNVLASHAVENILSELLHYVVQKVVEEGTPVWRQYKESLASIHLSSQRPKLKKLMRKPVPRPVDKKEVTFGDVASLAKLEADMPLVASCVPKCVWQDITRGGSSELQPFPNAPKGSQVAQITPRLTLKAKGTQVGKRR